MKIYTNSPSGRGTVIECSIQELESMRLGLRRVVSEEMDKTGGPYSLAPHTIRYQISSKMLDAVCSYLRECDFARDAKRSRKKKKGGA